MSIKSRLAETADYIFQRTQFQPQLAIVLGSGLGGFADSLQAEAQFAYAELPNFKQTGVSGHKGKLIFGQLNGLKIAVLQGRLHFYEGYSLEDVVFPVRLLAFLGTGAFLLTNAAGGINSDYQPGDLVIIRDHLNLLFVNPLIGPESLQLGPRFPDMGTAYNPDLQQNLVNCLQKMNLPVKKGVYAYVSGPAYETPAEIVMMKTLGADLVGMSTVPEVIALHQMGVKVAALSLVANKAAGLSKTPLTHAEVEAIARRSEQLMIKVLTEFCKQF